MDKFTSLVCGYQFCMAEAISQNEMEQWKTQNSYDLPRQTVYHWIQPNKPYMLVSILQEYRMLVLELRQ